MVEDQPLSDAQMLQLLQFVNGKAKMAVQGLEGIPERLSKALSILDNLFGQLHMIVNACVSCLISGPPVVQANTRAA